MPVIRQRDVYRFTLYMTLLVILSAFLLWPILLTVGGAFVSPQGGFTLDYFFAPGLGVLRDPVDLRALTNSLLIAVCTTTLCIAITLPLALLVVKRDFPGKSLVGGLILVPLILPPFVGAIGMRAVLGRFGAINAALMHMGILDPDGPGIDFLGGEMVGGRFWSVVIMEALHLYPILYVNLTAALANLDPALDEAARGLGASAWRRFATVTLPLITPGLFAGATIVFIWSFTELGTPLMFDYYNVTPVQIFWGIQEMQYNPRPYAQVVVMLTVAISLYMLGKHAFGRRAYAMQSKAAVAATTQRLAGWRGWLVTALFAGVIGVAVLPHLGVIFSSFTVDGQWYRTVLPSQWTLGHYNTALSHDLAMRSIQNSLTYALIAVVGTVVMGIAIAYLVTRVRITGGWLLDSLAMLPLAVPGLVMAFGYVGMTLTWPFPQIVESLNNAGLERVASYFQVLGPSPNPLLILVIAYSVRRLPYVVRAASAGLEQTSGQLEEAALNLGASTLTAIRKIVVPLIMANLIAGAILAFSFSMLEVSDSLLLAQKEEHYPITKAIFDFFGRLGDGPYIASAMGVWAMALLTITLVGAGIIMGKKLGAIFRA